MRVNQKIVSDTKNRSELLIIDICWDTMRLAVTELLFDSPKRLFTLSLDEVKNDICQGRRHIADHDFPKIIYEADNNLSPNWIKKRDEGLAALEPLISDPELRHRYLYGDSSGILQLLIEHSGKSKKYVTGQLNRYFRCGGMPNALLPNYFACGKNHQLPTTYLELEKGKICLASKRGRETLYGKSYRGITQQDIKNIVLFSKKIRSGTEVQLSRLYLNFCMEYASAELRPMGAPDEDIAEPFKMLLSRNYLISPKSFKRQLTKYVDQLTFLKKRVGSINYSRDFAGKPGLARAGLRGPASRYEIDSTIADIYIRYSYSKDELVSIGRPVIYSVVDSFSGMIVGLHVGFDSPCWHGASQALFNAMSNKVEFCRQYGYEIDESDWPCQEVCRELTLDRGSENTDSNITSLLRGQIGITVGNFNAYHRGDMKGTVEKSFDIIQSLAIPFDSGKVVKSPKKEDQHASRNSLYTYEQFMVRLIKCIIFTNNNRERVLSHNFEMSRDGVLFTSRSVWDWGLEQAILKPRVSTDRLRYALLPEAEATVRSQGVYFKGLYYNCNEIVRRGYLDRAKNIGRFKIKVRYTDISTNHIWYGDDESGELLQLDLTDRSEAYKNQIWANVMRRQEIVKEQLAILDESRFDARALLEMDIKQCDDAIRAESRHLKKSNAKGIQPGMKTLKHVEAVQQRYNEMQAIYADLSGADNREQAHRPAPQQSKQNLNDPTVISFQEDEQ